MQMFHAKQVNELNVNRNNNKWQNLINKREKNVDIYKFCDFDYVFCLQCFGYALQLWKGVKGKHIFMFFLSSYFHRDA